MCSSSNNGCSSCSPALYLWKLETSTSQNKVGFQCGNDFYKSKTGNGGKSRNASDNVICLSSSSSLSYSESDSYSYIIDKFGIIAIGMDANIQSYLSDYAGDGCDIYIDGTYTDSYSYKSRAKKDSCSQDETETSGDGFNISILYCDPNDEINEPCSGNCSRSDSCQRSQSNLSFSCSAEYQDYWARENATKNISVSLNTPLDLSYFYNLCLGSVSKKIQILSKNEPSNCNGDQCGTGNKDDCWGIWYGDIAPFSIANNNLDNPNGTSTTAQKIKFKISTSKQNFIEQYSSISGKIIFYTATYQDLYEERTPCNCGANDFAGNILQESAYSISAGETFKNNYFAGDAGEFSNEDQSLVGKSIYTCATVDNVEFID